MPPKFFNIICVIFCIIAAEIGTVTHPLLHPQEPTAESAKGYAPPVKPDT